MASNFFRRFLGAKAVANGSAASSIHAEDSRQVEPFVWLNKQGVRSREGFIVQSTGRFTIEYQEGSLKVTVNVERAAEGDQHSVVIDRTAFRRWDGASFDLSSESQARMLENFKSALAFQGIKVEF